MTGRKKAGLLRHDRMIVAKELRSALSSWGDRLIALAVLVVALLAVRSALSHRTFIFAATAVGGLASEIIAFMLDVANDLMDESGIKGWLEARATPVTREATWLSRILNVQTSTLDVRPA